MYYYPGLRLLQRLKLIGFKSFTINVRFSHRKTNVLSHLGSLCSPLIANRIETSGASEAITGGAFI